MSSNNALGTAVIDVVPNMSGFVTEMRVNLNGIDFASMGKEIGEGISQGVKEGLVGLNLQPVANGWMNSIGNLASITSLFTFNLRPLQGMFGGITTATQGAGTAAQGTTGSFVSLGRAFADFARSGGKYTLAIAAVVAVVAALAAGFLWLVDHVIGFSNIWEGLMVTLAPFKDAFAKVVSKIQSGIQAFMESERVMAVFTAALMALPFGPLIFALGDLGRSSKAYQAAQEDLTLATERHHEAVDRLYNANRGLEDAQHGVLMANRRVEDSYDALQRALDEHGEGSREAIRAQEDLERATLEYERAATRAEEATDDFAYAQTEQVEAAKEVVAANKNVEKAYDDLAAANIDLKGRTRAAWAGITSSVSSAGATIGEQVGNVASRAREMWNGANARAREVWNTVRDTIIGIVTALPERLTNIGRNIVQGLANGITNARERVTAAIRRITDAIPSTIRNILNINSPSRVLMKIGNGICEGLVLGLNDGASDVLNAA